ncbi:MAG: hypothetical protein SFU56_22505 [Capsulimonadales bacterium]|nr:hypothetical protein [Capsulimonadales bacterium]
MEPVWQIGGALCVLLAFVLAQLGRLRSDSFRYLILNAVGSGVLAILAAIDRQWGFLLLEGVWAIVSAYGIVRRLRVPAG